MRIELDLTEEDFKYLIMILEIDLELNKWDERKSKLMEERILLSEKILRQLTTHGKRGGQ